MADRLEALGAYADEGEDVWDDEDDTDSEGDGEDDSRVDIIDAKVRTLLEKAIRKHRLTEKQVEYWVQRFEQLHMTYKEVEQRESALLIKNQKLYKELRTIEERHQREDSKKVVSSRRIEVLDSQKRKALEELRLSEKQISENELVIMQKEAAIRNMERQVEEQKMERERREKPIVDAYKTQIADLRRDLNNRMLSFDRAKKKRDGLLSRIRDTEHAISDLRETVAEQKREFEKVRSRPTTERQQADLVQEALSNALRERDEALELLDTLRSGLVTSETALAAAEREEGVVEETRAAEKEASACLESELADARRELEVGGVQHNRMNEALLRLTSDAESGELHLKNLGDEIRASKRTQDARRRRIREVEKAIFLLCRNVDSLERKKADIGVDTDRLAGVIESHKERILSLSSGMDLQISEYMALEAAGDETAEFLDVKAQRVNMFEGDVQKLILERRSAQRHITQLTTERESVARLADVAKRKFVATVGQMKVVTFLNSELRKRRRLLREKLKAAKKRYTLLKTDRNRYARAIQENVQTLSQIQQNRRILDTEHEVLSRKSLEKENAHKRVCKANMKILDLQSKDKNKLSRCKQRLDELTKAFGEVNSQTTKLGTLLSEKQKEMLRLKAIYMQNVEERNATGVELVDRNDELCILYEKASTQERLLKEAQLEMQSAEDEQRKLRLRVDAAQRALRVLFARVPEARSLMQEKQSLDDQLVEATDMTSELAVRVENPSTSRQWRYLEGAVPTEEDLREEVLELEEKLNRKNEKIMEKMLILQEITKTSDGLRNVAMQRRNRSLDLALTVNGIQAKVREESQSIQALWAELAVVQSKVMHVEAHNKQLEIFRAQCQQRMFGAEAVNDEDDEAEDDPPRGRPGDDGGIVEGIPEWDREFERRAEAKQRRREQDLARRREREAMSQGGEGGAPFASDGTFIRVTQTTAVTRPTAYIADGGTTDDLGLPKPYLLKPVLPAKPSNQMERIFAKQRERQRRQEPIVL